MKVQVLRPALRDMHSSYRFYERQDLGLGSYFRECIDQDLISLQATAGIHSLHRGYHHVRSEIFQSILYYRIILNKVVVFAILDARISPQTRDRILSRRT
jgi:hypothetical protein